jgi:hypothetical protein
MRMRGPGPGSGSTTARRTQWHVRCTVVSVVPAWPQASRPARPGQNRPGQARPKGWPHTGLWPGLGVHQARARPAGHGFVPDLVVGDFAWMGKENNQHNETNAIDVPEDPPAPPPPPEKLKQ